MALTDLASQILDFTRIVTNADSLTPGKPLRVDILPGVMPSLPSVSDVAKLSLSNAQITQGQLSGTVVGTITGNIVGDITGALRVLPHDVKIKVTPSITRNGAAWVAPMANPSPLSFAFLLVPTISAESLASVPTHYEITLDVELTLSTNAGFAGSQPASESTTVNRSFVVPVDVPSIEIPSVLLMGRHKSFNLSENGDAGWLLVLVRAGSVLKSAGDVVRTFNTLMQTLRDLQSVLGWAGGLGLFIRALQDAVDIINKAPSVFFFVAGAREMGDFDDEGSSWLIIGTTGTTVSFYSQGNFNADFSWGDDERTRITLPDLGIEAGLPISIGVGRHRKDALPDWDTDAGDTMNDHVESVKFEPLKDQPSVSTPPAPQLSPLLSVKLGDGAAAGLESVVTVIARDPVMKLPLDAVVAIDSLGTVGRTNQPIRVTLRGAHHTAFVRQLIGYADASIDFTLPRLVVSGTITDTAGNQIPNLVIGRPVDVIVHAVDARTGEKVSASVHINSPAAPHEPAEQPPGSGKTTSHPVTNVPFRYTFTARAQPGPGGQTVLIPPTATLEAPDYEPITLDVTAGLRGRTGKT